MLSNNSLSVSVFEKAIAAESLDYSKVQDICDEEHSHGFKVASLRPRAKIAGTITEDCQVSESSLLEISARGIRGNGDSFRQTYAEVTAFGKIGCGPAIKLAQCTYTQCGGENPAADSVAPVEKSHSRYMSPVYNMLRSTGRVSGKHYRRLLRQNLAALENPSALSGLSEPTNSEKGPWPTCEADSRFESSSVRKLDSCFTTLQKTGSWNNCDFEMFLSCQMDKLRVASGASGCNSPTPSRVVSIQTQHTSQSPRRGAKIRIPLGDESAKETGRLSSGNGDPSGQSSRGKLTKGLYEQRSLLDLQILGLQSLEESAWLDSHVVGASLMILSRLLESEYYIIDPLMHSLSDDRDIPYQVPAFPLMRKALYPINIDNTHWVLAVFDFRLNTAVVLDPMMSSHSVFATVRRKIENVWVMCTGERLESVTVASRDSVCQQYDGHSCGIIAIYHGLRLMMGLSPRDPLFTKQAATSYRTSIRMFLDRNLHCNDGADDRNYIFPFETYIDSGAAALTILVVDRQQLPLPTHVPQPAVAVEMHSPEQPVESAASVACSDVPHDLTDSDSDGFSDESTSVIDTMMKMVSTVDTSADTTETTDLKSWQLVGSKPKKTVSKKGNSGDPSQVNATSKGAGVSSRRALLESDFMERLVKIASESGQGSVAIMSPRIFSSLSKKCLSIEMRPCCVLDLQLNPYDVLLVPIISCSGLIKALAIGDRRSPGCKITVYSPSSNIFVSLDGIEITKLKCLFQAHGWNTDTMKVVDTFDRDYYDIPYYLLTAVHAEVVCCSSHLNFSMWSAQCEYLEKLNVLSQATSSAVTNGRCCLHAGVCSCQVNPTLKLSKLPSTSVQDNTRRGLSGIDADTPSEDMLVDSDQETNFARCFNDMEDGGGEDSAFDDAVVSDFKQKVHTICQRANATAALMPSFSLAIPSPTMQCCLNLPDDIRYSLLIVPIITDTVIRGLLIADRRLAILDCTEKPLVTVYGIDDVLLSDNELESLESLISTHGWPQCVLNHVVKRVDFRDRNDYLLYVLNEVVYNWKYDFGAYNIERVSKVLREVFVESSDLRSVINSECFLSAGCVCPVLNQGASTLKRNDSTRIVSGGKHKRKTIVASNTSISKLLTNDSALSSGVDVLSTQLSDMVSYLLHVIQSEKVTDAIVMSPTLMNDPTVLFKCMQHDLRDRHKCILFMPAMMDGKHLSLIVVDRRKDSTKTTVKLYQPALDKRKAKLSNAARNVIKLLFATHRYPDVRVTIDSIGNKIDCEQDILYYLLFLGRELMLCRTPKPTKPILRQFKTEYISNKSAFSLKSCAHYSSCVCNLSSGIKARKSNVKVGNHNYNYEIHSLGKMVQICTHCMALGFENENYAVCCSRGTVEIPANMLSTCYDPVLKPFRDTVLLDRNLYKALRPLNNMLSCAYNKMTLRNFKGHGETPVILEGAVKVSVCHLQVKQDSAAFALLYLASDELAKKEFLRKPSDEGGKPTDSFKKYVPESIFEFLLRTLKDNNVIVATYKTMYEMLIAETEKRLDAGNTEPVSMLMNIKNKREAPDGLSKGQHEGRLNRPPNWENQVAAIWIAENSAELPSNEELVKGIRVTNRLRANLPEVPHFAPNIEPLCYPLIYALGQIGYRRENGLYRPSGYQSKKKNQSTDDTDGYSGDTEAVDNPAYVSRRQYCCALFTRTERNRFIHRVLGLGKLTAQYIIHEFTRIEADRLSAIRQMRTEVRCTTPSSRFSYLQKRLEERNIKLGKLVELPSYFPGSDSYYRQRYNNSMTVALREGNPHFFITMTGNPYWPEITDNLLNGFESWITDPLLVVRVFHLKLQHLFYLLDKCDFFDLGAVAAIEHSIEFQKRGMPHAHILITFKKAPSLDDIDRIITAEIPKIPNKDDPHYKVKVAAIATFLKHNVHSPCKGKDHLSCRADDPGKCSKGFPKKFFDKTSISPGGFVNYRRRDEPENFAMVGAKKTIPITNADIVPGNLELSHILDCHINVEACTGLSTFKYIFKYIYKGADRIIIELTWKKNAKELSKRVYLDENGQPTVDIDMTKEYVNARYIGQCEAAWRIHSFPLNGSLHVVSTLYVHLPDEQPIYFREGTVPSDNAKSPLLAYFQLCSSDAEAKAMTWTEVDENYRYDRKEKVYRKYKREFRRISTLGFVSPKFGEKYAVRCLLLKRKGVTSFADLRTVNNIVHPTFISAAQALGYIFEDAEWENCLKLLCHYAMPRKIRCMYASLLVHCNVLNARELWLQFREQMRNRSRRTVRSDKELDDISLSHIEWILQLQNTSLVNFGMGDLLPSGNTSYTDVEFDEDLYDNDTTTEANTPILNEKQTAVMNKLSESLLQESTSAQKRIFFLYGKAGCGKTFLTNLFIDTCRKNGKVVVAVASTGIAATLLKNGRTAHSAFHIPAAELNEKSRIHSEASSPHAEYMRKVDVIVWDEICMQSKYAMEAVDRWLRDIVEPSKRHLPFGGKMVMFSGDWAQFLPVVITGNNVDLRASTVSATLKRSYIWSHVEVLELDQNMRVRAEEVEHMEWLRKVGEGKCQSIDGVHIRLPENMYVESERQVIDWIYTDEVLKDSKMLAKCALLTVTNKYSLVLNESILSKMPGDTYELFSTDEPLEEDDGVAGMPAENMEYVNAQTPSGMPPHKLLVKKGSIVMLLRNVDICSRLCNGTRLEILDVLRCGNATLLHCRHLNGGLDDTCFIQRMPLTYTENEKRSTGLAFKRIQFPVRLCFSMTINKAQGQTFDKVGLIMKTPSFAHGSTYVALSRATSSTGIRLTMDKPIASGVPIWVRNIVYEDVL